MSDPVCFWQHITDPSAVGNQRIKERVEIYLAALAKIINILCCITTDKHQTLHTLVRLASAVLAAAVALLRTGDLNNVPQRNQSSVTK